MKLRFATIPLAVLGVVLFVFGVLNFRQRNLYQAPDDGVSWLDAPEGVKAWVVAAGGPGERAGIRAGDFLKAINGHPILRAIDAAKAVFRSGVWSQASYDLLRNGQRFVTTVIIAPQDTSSSLHYYLDVVGLLYLFVGTFILFRRWSATKSVHFYLFCLASFVLYAFSYTGKLNLFDTIIYWLNVVAWLIQPAVFLHFCLSFPERPAFLKERRYVFPLLYVPAALLLAIHVMVWIPILILPLPLLQTRWLLDRVELIHLAIYFVLGGAALFDSYRRADWPLRKQQLKWVTRGTFLAIVPFAGLYVVPYFLGFIPAPWMKLSVLSLIFLPLSFGYAIVRYRLMDVDIIFQRGLVYTLATATIVGLYFGLIALFADFFRTNAVITSREGYVLAIIVTAILFQPVVNWIQARLERVFNRERYDYRRTLLEFAREITSELHRDRLLEQVAERLTWTLDVERLAVFLAEKDRAFRLAVVRGFEYDSVPDLSFLDPARPELKKGYLFFDSVRRPLGFDPFAQATIEQLNLHYYLPLKVKDRTLGYLGLGKTRQGAFLSSEDIDLLQTIQGYVSIALENAGLYGSLEQRARQYQTLKDFNENIIESINAGVLASNPDEIIEFWNSGMEKLYGLARAEAVGKNVGNVLPPEILAELPQGLMPHSAFSLYKTRLRTAQGRSLIVNLSVTPLVGREDQVIGRLFIFNDITERVNLEDQLVQAEKLSSIGLLAAGVAHEVNTPLTVITSQAQMLMKQMPLDDPRTHTLDRIIKQAFRASEIVNHLLKFSRVSGSEFAELDLNKVIQETLSLVDPMLRGSRISLNAQMASALPTIFGNAGKLQQVFMNLIMNARDAMPLGGELTIATESENSTVRVEVSDNGMGIPTSQLNRIFDPFFTTKSTSRGTGLGLAVTYGIIREHSGNIRVESDVGRGTSFFLEFPTARKALHVS